MRRNSRKLIEYKGIILYEKEANLINKLETLLNVELKPTKFEFPKPVEGLLVYTISTRCFTTSANHVTGLSLEWRDLSNYPKIISKFKYLINLSLARTKIKRLPRSFSKLKNLKSLSLRRNNFEKFPKSILGLVNLKYLDLALNSIKKLPLSLSKLKSMRKLFCAYNQIEYIPETISNLKNLKYLDVAGNDLKTLPASLFKIKSLRILSISSKYIDADTKDHINKIKKEFEALATLAKNKIKKDREASGKGKIPPEIQIPLHWYFDKIPKLYIATPPYKIAFFYEHGGEMFWSRNDNAGLIATSSPYDFPISSENAQKFNELHHRWATLSGHPDSSEWEAFRLETRELLLDLSSKVGDDFIFTNEFDFYVKKLWFVVNEYIMLTFVDNEVILHIKNDKDGPRSLFFGLLGTILGVFPWHTFSSYSKNPQAIHDFIVDTAQYKPTWNEQLKEKVTLEEKFWEICSNFQVWAENDYNTDILHYSLSIPLFYRLKKAFKQNLYSISIPLLYRLKKAGDPLAKRVFNKEMLRNFIPVENHLEFAELTDEELFREILYIKNKWFQINDFIKLLLENGKTQIYVNDEKFLQCSRLVLNIPIKEVDDYEEINSIDEAADVNKNKSIWLNQIIQGPEAHPDRIQKHDISPEQEFWGHCSNLQMWAEHNYDTRLLHSNLSFPLLKELANVGDPLAKRVFKEEIVKRFESGNKSVMTYLREEGYLNYLNKDEKSSI